MGAVAPSPAWVSLGGDAWRCRSYLGDEWQSARMGEIGIAGTGGWLPASVPGSLVADLHRAGQVPDPYVGLNTRSAEWAASRSWAYQTEFDIAPPAPGERVELVLEGVDYASRIFLDGDCVGEHESQFTPARFDVTDRLRAGGRHVLAVLIAPAPESESQTGDTARARVHKTRMSYGWDFCPRLIHQGIWRPIGLRRTGPLRIENPFVRTQLAADQRSARLVCEVAVDAPAPADALLRVDVTMEGAPVAEATVAFAANIGVNPVVATVDFVDPLLWWPNGSGAQPLYQVDVSVEVGGHVSDRTVIDVGVRKLELSSNPGAPTEARRYLLLVNDRPIPINGWNWVPIDMLYGVPRPEKLEHLLQLARGAHVNLLRVWGGGLIESDEFYGACDRLGILVWQEFIQSSSGVLNAPAEDAAFVDLMRAEAEGIVPLRRNHPSLALWCGGNELMRDGRPLDERAPVLGALRDVVARLDPDRPFLPTSPSGPVANFVDIADDGVGHDVHGPWEHQGINAHQALYNSRSALLHSEFGVEGMSSIAAIEATIPHESRWPPTRDNPEYAHRGSWWNNEPLVQAAFGGGLDDLPSLVRASQFLQADGLRYAVETSLRRRWLSSGTLPWQFNESFPNAWCTSAVEWSGRPKPGYYAVAQAYEAVHLSASFERQAWAGAPLFAATVWVTSSLPDDVEASLTARCLAADGRELARADRQVSCHGLTSEPVAEISARLDQDVAGNVFVLDLHLADAGGVTLSANRYLFSTTADLAPLRALPDGMLEEARSIESAHVWRLTFRNVGNILIPALTIDDGRPALAAGWSIPDANLVTLLPGEERNVAIRFTAVPEEERRMIVSDWTVAERVVD